jgi:hypothetical protein
MKKLKAVFLFAATFLILSIHVNAAVMVTAGFQGLSSAFNIATGGTCPSFPFALSASSSCTVRVAFSPKFELLEADYLSFHPWPIRLRTPFAPRVYLSGVGKSSGTVSPTAPAVPSGVRIDSIKN